MARSIGSERHSLRARQPGSFGRICFQVKTAEVRVLPIHRDRRYPLVATWLPPDAAMVGCPAARRHVLAVAPVRDRAKVLAATVQSVAVDVVALEPIAVLQTEQLAVEQDGPLLPVNKSAPHGIASRQTPCPLTGPFCICGVDAGVG